MFVAFRQNIINSAFLTLKEILLALNHCYKILRSWVTFWLKPLVIYQIAVYCYHLQNDMLLPI